MFNNTDDIARIAVEIYNAKGRSAAMQFIDSELKLPNCAIEKQKVNWKRTRAKESMEAMLRQTKTTGPAHYK